MKRLVNPQIFSNHKVKKVINSNFFSNPYMKRVVNPEIIESGKVESSFVSDSLSWKIKIFLGKSRHHTGGPGACTLG